MAKNKTRKKVKELSAEEFFSKGFDSDVVSDVSSIDEEKTSSKRVNPAEEDERANTEKNSRHKSDLLNLEKKDPEFYKFLKENDQELLEFDESDESSNEDSEMEDMDRDNEVQKDIQKRNKNENTAFDETDEEKDVNSESFIREGETVTMDVLVKLKRGLEKNSLCSLRKIMRMFHAAVAEASDDEERKSTTKFQYKIQSSAVFNSLVQICLKSVSNTLNHYLVNEKKPKKAKKMQLPSSNVYWSKVKVTIKCYLQDLLQLLRQLTEPSMLATILKHVQELCLYYACFPKIAKMLVKRLVRMWSSAEEHVRVVAFLCLRKMALLMPMIFDFMLKQLYLAYVKNSKFVAPKTKPVIVFMQNSLIEMFSMNRVLTYQYGFIYIRQMAIHLRNALTLKKKESYQSVYNWQYIGCIHLWSRALGELHDETLAPLIFPLAQIGLGVIRLIPTAKYYPLRFHCIHSLNVLSKHTDTYIPIASYLVEILESPEFNKKPKPSTSASLDLSCVLKFTKAQLHTRSFQDSVLDNICNLLLEHFVIHSTSISFPELIFPVCLRMKRFMKKTQVIKLSKQIKQIVDKLQEAGHEVTKKRSTVNFSPKDLEEVKKWEISFGQEKNCLQKFYETWLKMREIANASAEQEIEEETSDEDEPKKKKKKLESKSRRMTETIREDEKQRRIKQLARNHMQEDQDDIVEDFHMSSSEED